MRDTSVELDRPQVPQRVVVASDVHALPHK
jgi:hypothetical protein